MTAPLHTKSKQANDIILKENDRTISDKKEIANLLITVRIMLIIPASKQSTNTGGLALQLALVFITSSRK